MPANRRTADEARRSARNGDLYDPTTPYGSDHMSSSNPGTTLRDQQRLQTRQRLLEAASTVFAERGYTHVSVEDIANEVGASRATFYLHFRSKRDLLDVQLEEERPDLVRRYQELSAALADPATLNRRFMSRWLRAWYDWWSEHVPLVLAIRDASVVEPQGVLRTELGEDLIGVATSDLQSLDPEAKDKLRGSLTILRVMTQEVFNVLVENEKLNPHLDVDDALDLLTTAWLTALRRQPGVRPAVRVIPGN
jgi:AcrR family transcriptional regulator